MSIPVSKLFVNRDDQHTLTQVYKKGKKAVTSVIKYSEGSLKLLSPSLDLLATIGFLPEQQASALYKGISKGVSLTCSVIKTPSNFLNIAKDIKSSSSKGADVTKKFLRVVSNISAIALGAMTCFKLGDATVELFGTVAGLFGKGFKVVGISSMAPFLGAFSGIEIIKSTVDAGIEGVKLYKTCKKIVANVKKTKVWKKLDWNDSTFFTNKINRMNIKQLRARKDLEKMEGAFKTSIVAYEKIVKEVDNRWKKLDAKKLELTHRHPIVRLFGQIVPQIKLTGAILKKESIEKKNLAKLTRHNKLLSKHTLRSIKIRNYKIIENKIKNNNISKMDEPVLNQFKANQIQKLKIKKSNLKLKALKSGLKIGLKIIVIISMIASMALTFSGVGSLPGIITTASMALFILVAEYGLKKFNQYNKPKTWSPVKVPKLFVKS